MHTSVLSSPMDSPCWRLFLNTSICQHLSLEQDLFEFSIQNSSIRIQFKYETNLPLILEHEDLHQYIIVSPPIMNHELFSAIWISTTQLQITMDGTSIYPAHDVNISFSDNMLHWRNRISRNVKFPEVGQYQVSIKDRDTHDVIASSNNIHVNPCPANIIIPATSNDPDRQIVDLKSLPREVYPQREFRILGPLALSGREKAKVGHKSLKSLQSDSFAVSFWIRLMEPPTGEFRTIFFKGGTSGQRHPSMWLLPNVNRLTIRTSTMTDIDVGAESKIEIPLNQWCFIALNFENRSFNRDQYNHAYAITLFVNNVMDTTFLFKVFCITSLNFLMLKFPRIQLFRTRKLFTYFTMCLTKVQHIMFPFLIRSLTFL